MAEVAAGGSGLPADGVVTGRGTVDGRPVVVVANDPTVKAGSWGARTVEKMVRATETALREELPIVWLVDSAGARITDQVELFPGRRGAGRIFHNQVAISGRVPQVCCLFGPSAAGGAYVPSFCDIVIMVEGNASMYLGSPRMAEMVVGERVDLEQMGGARMHCTVSGCGDLLADDDADAIEQARLYLSYLPRTWREDPPALRARGRRRGRCARATCRRGSPSRSTCTTSSSAWSTRTASSRSSRCSRPSSSSGSAGSRAAASGSWPTTPRSRAGCCSSTAPTRRPGSSPCATRSTCRSSTSPTCPGS